MKNVFGLFGDEIFLTEHEKIPYYAQLTTKKYSGVAFIDNNLSRAPIFIQSKPKTDFLLICEIKNGKKRYFI